MSEGKSEQVNIRLTPMEHDVMRALAFLNNSSGAEVVRDAVGDFLANQAQDPDVKTALRALAENRARKDGTLATMKRRQVRKPDTG